MVKNLQNLLLTEQNKQENLVAADLDTLPLQSDQTLSTRVSFEQEDFWLASLVSGSSGNAYLVFCGGRYFLFDTGLSLKKFKAALQELKLTEIQLTAIFITHEHSDHVQGLLSIQKHFKAPVYTGEKTVTEILRRFPRMDEACFSPISNGETIFWEDIGIRAHEISHDAVEPLAYSLEYTGKEILILTDTGKCPTSILENIKNGPDLVVLEANYQDELLLSGPYPYLLKQRVRGEFGHLSNEQSAEIIEQLALRGSRHFVLAHLSAQNNFPELANLTIRSYLKKHLPQLYPEISLQIAPRFTTLGPIYCGETVKR